MLELRLVVVGCVLSIIACDGDAPSVAPLTPAPAPAVASPVAEPEPAAPEPDDQRACDQGDGPACHRLGERYRDGKGVAPDDGRARALFEQGCRQGSSAACDALGH